MPLASRALALLLLTLLWCSCALARNTTYEGVLTPNNDATPISIVLQLEDLGGILSGSMKLSGSLSTEAPIQNGRNVAGVCNLNSLLSSTVTLRLFGDCTATTFEGNYTIYYTQPRSVARGTFRLVRKVPMAKGDKGTEGATPVATISSCMKTNTHCLAVCPRGDPDIEYLCSNRCRTKLQACKTQVKRQAAEDEPN